MITGDNVVVIVSVFEEDVEGIVLIVHILLISTIFLTRTTTLVALGATIFQFGFARDKVVCISIGSLGLARVVIFRLNAPDGLQDTINILLIDDIVFVLTSDARSERIRTVIVHRVLVDAFVLSDLLVNGLFPGNDLT